MTRYLLLLCLSFVFLSCSQKTERKLVWSDEFDKPGAPDAAKWDYDPGDGCPNNCGWGNNELEYYTNDPKNVRVEDGNLIIEAHQEEKGGKPYTSTRIVSKGKGDWLYGRIETRAKLPKGRGTWPAIWMLPTDWSYGGWPESGEIDIMEHVGFDPGVVHGTIHTGKYNHIKGTQIGKQVQVPDFDQAFHIYAVEWTEDKLDFFIDDNLYLTINRNPSDDFNGWPFDKRFHLIMNLAVGGNWGGQQGVDESIWPQRLVVDYVRIYQ